MSFPLATEMFHFARFASLYPKYRDTPKGVGFPIQKSTDQRMFTPPRSLSQCTTSFIAARCQGIHQMPFYYLMRVQRIELTSIFFKTVPSLLTLLHNVKVRFPVKTREKILRARFCPLFLVEAIGIEPTTSCLQSMRSTN